MRRPTSCYGRARVRSQIAATNTGLDRHDLGRWRAATNTNESKFVLSAAINRMRRLMLLRMYGGLVKNTRGGNFRSGQAATNVRRIGEEHTTIRNHRRIRTSPCICERSRDATAVM